jgi:tetratricopeptide (TPR) repeat protein/predicted Ser/Thr protein kinase
MSQDRRPSSSGDPDRAARIDAILDDLLRQHKDGSSIDAADVGRAHPELMPELGERLSALEAIAGARQKALRAEHVPESAGDRDAWLAEDLEFLRRTLQDYEVLERLRYGGQGIVYRARQTGANRMVAIKVLLDGPLASDRQRHRFEREIELISRLRHPNIVTLYEAGVIRGRHYFAMEYVDGRPVDDYVILNDLTPREIVSLFTKVCRAVSYAHQNGVIHRDLSPANILVDEQGEPHVFDFGLAKDVRASDDAQAYSFTGQVFGTLQYLSPEQAGGLDGKVDTRSDIYTLGVVLYELLTDAFPYPVRGELTQVRNAILNIEPEPLRRAARCGGKERIRDLDTINRDLEAVLAKALAKPKDERYGSMAEFADDLDRCLAGDAVTARVDNPLYLLRKTLRRYRLPVAVAGILLLAFGASAVAVSALWMRASHERDNAREATRVAYDLFDAALTDLDTAVRPLAGGVAVRDRMIAVLADRLPQLEQLIESDEALSAVSTRLVEKHGDLALEQGGRAHAARYYRLFLEGSRRLAEMEPHNLVHLDSIARAYRKCAAVSDEPEPAYERGIQFTREVLEQHPLRDETRYNLAELHAAFGRQLVDSERFQPALEQFDAVLSLGLPEQPEARGRWYDLVASAKDARGRILLQLGRGEAGLAELEASLRLRERIVEARPADTAARHGLMLSYVDLATADRDAGHPEKARERLEKAIALGELLRAMDPTVTSWGFALYGARDRLARLYLNAKDWAQAQDQCERAVALAEELARAERESSEGMLRLGFAHILRGKVLRARAEHESQKGMLRRAFDHVLRGQAASVRELLGEAYAEFKAAASIRASLVEADPTNPALRADLAVAADCLGSAARRLGKLAQAKQHFQKAYQIRRELYEEQPGIVERALDYIRARTNLAVVHLEYETEADDSIAAKLIDEARRHLDTMYAAGKLVGLEGEYEGMVPVLDTNQRIIRKRAQSLPAEWGDNSAPSDRD